MAADDLAMQEARDITSCIDLMFTEYDNLKSLHKLSEIIT